MADEDNIAPAPQGADSPGVDKEALAEAQAQLRQFGVTEKDTGVANVANVQAPIPASATRPLPPIFDKGAQTFVLNERTNNAAHLKRVGEALKTDPENEALQGQQGVLLSASNSLATLPKGEWDRYMKDFRVSWDAEHSTNGVPKLPGDLQAFVDRTRQEAVEGISLTRQVLDSGGLDANEVPAIRQQEQYLRGLTNALPRMTVVELETMRSKGSMPDQEELQAINQRPLPTPAGAKPAAPTKGK